MTEAEMKVKYGEEATERFLDMYHNNTSVATLVETIIRLYMELGQFDMVMAEVQQSIDDDAA